MRNVVSLCAVENLLPEILATKGTAVASGQPLRPAYKVEVVRSITFVHYYRILVFKRIHADCADFLFVSIFEGIKRVFFQYEFVFYVFGQPPF